MLARRVVSAPSEQHQRSSRTRSFVPAVGRLTHGRAQQAMRMPLSNGCIASTYAAAAAGHMPAFTQACLPN